MKSSVFLFETISCPLCASRDFTVLGRTGDAIHFFKHGHGLDVYGIAA